MKGGVLFQTGKGRGRDREGREGGREREERGVYLQDRFPSQGLNKTRHSVVVK